MKVKMTSKVKSIARLDGDTIIELEFKGRVQDTRLVDAKKANMTATLILKTAVADDIRLGSLFTVMVDDEADLDLASS